MSVDVDDFLSQIVPATRAANGSGPTERRIELRPDTQAEFAEYEARVDSLFGAKSCTLVWKNEKPEHRLMLWLRLQGHSNKEIAAITGYKAVAISQITRQPWFLEAFTRISTEMGKDAVDRFLTGETVPTLQKLVSLRDNAESEQVQLAASNSILDRIRGKPTVRVESKSESNVTVAVFDAEKLREEYARNQQILAAHGVHQPN